MEQKLKSNELYSTHLKYRAMMDRCKGDLREVSNEELDFALNAATAALAKTLAEKKRRSAKPSLALVASERIVSIASLATVLFPFVFDLAL